MDALWRATPEWSGDPRVKPAAGAAILNPQHQLARDFIWGSHFNVQGPRTIDVSRYGLHGDYDGITVPSEMFGMARKLSGSAQDVQVTHQAHLAPTKALSIVMRIFWIGSTEAYNSPVSNEVSANGYTLLLKSTQKMAVYIQGQGSIDPCATTIPFSKWTTIATTTLPFGFIRTHVDGKFDSQVGAGGALNMTGLTTLRFGSSSFGAGRYFNGIIDYAYLWNRELTQHEISWLHFQPYSFFQRAPRRFFYSTSAASLSGSADPLAIDSATGGLSTGIPLAGSADPLALTDSGALTTGIPLIGSADPLALTINGEPELFAAATAGLLAGCGNAMYADGCNDDWLLEE